MFNEIEKFGASLYVQENEDLTSYASRVVLATCRLANAIFIYFATLFIATFPLHFVAVNSLSNVAVVILVVSISAVWVSLYIVAHLTHILFFDVLIPTLVEIF